MARAIWKGTISFGLVTIPVGLFSAVAPRELAFHLLDSQDMSPVRQKRVSETTGEEVPWERVVKGFQLDDGTWVTLTDEDFAQANVKATRTIDVLGAVCVRDVDPEYYDTPYVLAPETAGMKAYALLREALRNADRVAIAQIVIRSRQRLCAIMPHGDALELEVLRYPYELRGTEGLELPGSDLKVLGVTVAETNLAEQLVSTIESDWNPEQYKDTYHDDLLALIQRKAQGETITPTTEPEQPMAEVVDIMELLKQSLEQARAEKKPPAAAAGA